LWEAVDGPARAARERRVADRGADLLALLLRRDAGPTITRSAWGFRARAGVQTRTTATICPARVADCRPFGTRAAIQHEARFGRRRRRNGAVLASALELGPARDDAQLGLHMKDPLPRLAPRLCPAKIGAVGPGRERAWAAVLWLIVGAQGRRIGAYVLRRRQVPAACRRHGDDGRGDNEQGAKRRHPHCLV